MAGPPGAPQMEKYRFKPGQSGNPRGAAAHDPLVKSFKKTSYQEFIIALQKYGTMTAQELRDDLARPEVTMFEKIFGKIVEQASEGDYVARQLLIDRLWGKLKDSDVNINMTSLSDLELIERAKEAIKFFSQQPVTIQGEVSPSEVREFSQGQVSCSDDDLESSAVREPV